MRAWLYQLRSGITIPGGRDALRRSWRSATPEVSDADGIGQADRRAGRVRLGTPHDHRDQRRPLREATLQLVALPIPRDLLPLFRRYPLSDLLDRHVAGDGLPPSGRGAGPRSGRPVARPAAGGAPGSLGRGAAADQGAGLPGRDVAAADRLPPAALPVDLVASPVLVGRQSPPMARAANPGPASEATPWHAIAADEVVRRLESNTASGLDAAEARRRLERYGPNRLPEARKQGPLMRLLLQFKNVLVYVLLGAGFIKAMMGLWLDASVILGVVILNALLGFIQEGRAEKALDSIRNMLSAEARTVRGGETRMIPAEELVPGDVVLLESGDRIPADLRLADVKNLRTEEAALTGESVPADKTTDPVAANATVGDRTGMAFSGTLVVSGRAAGVVVGTGSHTELGRINQMLAAVSPLETPLLRQIKKFGTAITVVILVVSVVMFAFGRWVRTMPFVVLFQAVTGIAVSAIPEGLPALITITLAIGVQRMAQRNAIIRRLPAVETLGSVSRICSDKTGTLTLMEMMVVSAVTGDAPYKITGQGYAPEGEVLKDGAPAGPDPVLGLMGRVSMLCNDAELHREEGAWKVEGDPTEGALYPFGNKLGLERPAEQTAYPRIDEIPFESEHRFMATLHKDVAGK